MSSIKGTKTEENLRAALTGESLARNKYSFFAMAARQNGFDDIANTFERLSQNEMMHAKFWFEALYGKPGQPTETLLEAARGEYGEWHDMYPGFAAQARADGFEDLAIMFERVAAIECDHDRQFMSLYTKIINGKSESVPTQMPTPAARPAAAPEPERPATVLRTGYRCQFCGATFDWRPDVCEVCKAIGSFDQCTVEVPAE